MELDGRPVEPGTLAALALYNYGHFTSMLVDRGRVRGLSLHLRRLVADCRTLFDAELDAERVRALVRRACVEPLVVARVTVFAPELELGSPGRAARPRVLVSTRPASAGSDRASPLRLRTVRYQRDMPAVKHVGLFAAMWHRRAAQLAGFDDALFVDERGRVCEGTTWNIGFVVHEGLAGQEGAVVWPRADCLDGVTMRLLRDAGRPPSCTSDIDLPTVRRLRAAFVTNAAVGVRPLASIDDVSFVADDTTVAALGEAYAAVPAEDL